MCPFTLAGSSKLKEGLPQECQMACSFAISKLDEVFRQLHMGDITIIDLQVIKKEQQQMKRLCESASTQQTEASNSVEKSYEATIFAVEQRMEEFEIFREQKGILHHLCKEIHHEIKGILCFSSLNMQTFFWFLSGVSEVKAELQTDYNAYKINTLCTRSGETTEVICFQSASSLQPFAKQFWIMTRRYNSAIFNSTWSETMSFVHHNNHTMTISDVGPKIWKPAFTQCQKLLDQLKDESLTLSSVDKHFHQYKGKLQTLKGELEHLFQGITCCGIDENPRWIHLAVTRIEEYWRLCEYCEAANSFLKLRDSLELTKGNFKDVENISKEVNIQYN